MTPPSEVIRPPSKAALWQVKGQRDILVHDYLPLAERGTASTRGIMPHLQVSGYVRPTARTDEVTEWVGATSLLTSAD